MRVCPPQLPKATVEAIEEIACNPFSVDKRSKVIGINIITPITYKISLDKETGLFRGEAKGFLAGCGEMPLPFLENCDKGHRYYYRVTIDDPIKSLRYTGAVKHFFGRLGINQLVKISFVQET
jgi:hypothetical protein